LLPPRVDRLILIQFAAGWLPGAFHEIGSAQLRTDIHIDRNRRRGCYFHGRLIAWTESSPQTTARLLYPKTILRRRTLYISDDRDHEPAHPTIRPARTRRAPDSLARRRQPQVTDTNSRIVKESVWNRVLHCDQVIGGARATRTACLGFVLVLQCKSLISDGALDPGGGVYVCPNLPHRAGFGRRPDRRQKQPSSPDFPDNLRHLRRERRKNSRKTSETSTKNGAQWRFFRRPKRHFNVRLCDGDGIEDPPVADSPLTPRQRLPSGLCRTCRFVGRRVAAYCSLLQSIAGFGASCQLFRQRRIGCQLSVASDH
jgi:hypothetical protein